MVAEDNDGKPLSDAAAETGKGKSGKGEGAMGRGKPQATAALVDAMKRFGMPVEQIMEVIRNWSHLNGKALAERLADFFDNTARASAHMVVQFSNKGFDLISRFLSYGRAKDPVPIVAARPDAKGPSPV